MNTINFYNKTIIVLFLSVAVNNAMETKGKDLEIHKKRENKEEQEKESTDNMLMHIWQEINEANRKDKPLSRCQVLVFNEMLMNRELSKGVNK